MDLSDVDPHLIHGSWTNRVSSQTAHLDQFSRFFVQYIRVTDTQTDHATCDTCRNRRIYILCLRCCLINQPTQRNRSDIGQASVQTHSHDIRRQRWLRNASLPTIVARRPLFTVTAQSSDNNDLFIGTLLYKVSAARCTNSGQLSADNYHEYTARTDDTNHSQERPFHMQQHPQLSAQRGDGIWINRTYRPDNGHDIRP